MQPEKKAQCGPLASTADLSSSGRAGSYLGPSLRIKGEIIGDENLHLEGMVEGLVSIGGHQLSIGKGSTLVAEIVAREAVIYGNVIGDISAFDRIDLKRCATVVGKLRTGKIIVEEGAYLNGAIETDSNGAQMGADLETLLSRCGKAEEKQGRGN